VRSFVSLCLALAPTLPTLALAEETGDVEEVHIISVRENRTSKGATGLTLDIKETPQSISVVTRDMMDSYGASNLNDALRLATGINVEEWETNRTNYEARGFEIKNTQLDGIGLPNNWGLVTGAMDSFGYEKLEVIRGANGLLTGVGNSSGTINYVRKRPRNTAGGELGLTFGSYDRKRVEADYSTPLTASGDWAARFIAAGEDADSYLRGYDSDRVFAYGVVDGQLTEHSTLAVGYQYQKTHSQGGMWGALVFTNADGTQASFDRSASTSQDWTFWDTSNKNAFVEYGYQLPKDWELKLSYNYRSYRDENKLFFAYTEVGLDADGLGLVGWPGNWPTEDDAQLADASLSGEYSLFGSTQQATFGVNRSKGKRLQYVRPASPDEPAFGLLPAFPYAGDAIPEPVWGEKTLDSRTDDTLTRYYGATRLKFGPFSTILGFNAAKFERRDTVTLSDHADSQVSPYVGLNYEFTSNISGYASYSDIYQPQDYTDITGAYLDPSKGVNYEVGVKGEWLDRRLLTTLALFKAEQQGLGTFAGYDPSSGSYFYVGEDKVSKGVELEINGRLNSYVRVLLGITSLSLENPAGADIDEWVPRQTVNLSFESKVPSFQRLSFGIGGQWRAHTSTIDSYTSIEVKQDAYTLLNAYARYDATDHMQVRLNLSNLTDEKYITSLYQVGYYGAPRTVAASFRYTF
jgi:outer membrane receptor for ferric coprogen and ferric-rhodotorulic acid